MVLAKHLHNPLTIRKSIRVIVKILLNLSISLWGFGVLQAQERQDQAVEAGGDTLSSLSEDSTHQVIRYLVLEKGGVNKRIRFYPGEKIWFRLKGEKHLYRRRIEAVEDSSLVLNGTEVPFSAFDRIILRRKGRLVRLLGEFLWRAGAGYYLIDLVNNSFVSSKGSLRISAILVGTGLLLKFIMGPRKIKLNKRHYLKSIQKF